MVMNPDPMPEPGSDEFKAWRKRHPAFSSAKEALSFYVFLYSALAIAYLGYRIVFTLASWLIAKNLYYGVGGVLLVASLGALCAWLYVHKRRVFGVVEMGMSLVFAFYFVQHFFVETSITNWTFQTIIDLTGTVFLCAQGLDHAKRHVA
jgi:hypothetical protein